jgi:GDP-L-fucose synthase
MAATEAVFPLSGRSVWVAGHHGLVGSAIQRRLAREDCEIVTVGRAEVDLRRQAEVEDWLAETKPDVIIVAAATVGGILANATRPAEFLYDNLAIESNIIEGAHRTAAKKLLFLGSACIYPKHAPQPMPEGAMLTGPLEPTNEWYAIAKIAGIKLCQAYRHQYGLDFISAMPTNLYGPGDNFDLESSHVLPALLRKVHEAKSAGTKTVEIWGSGKPQREFLYVDDCADAVIYLLTHYSGEEHVNVGSGEEVSIAELARTVATAVGFGGTFHYDSTKPDGMPRKLLDVSRLTAMGWRAETALAEGIRRTYDWYLKNPKGKSG